MANFRTNHNQVRGRGKGSPMVRIFLLVIIAVVIFLIMAFLFRSNFFTSSTSSESGFNYEVPHSGKDASGRYFFPGLADGELIHHKHYSLSYVEDYELAEWVAYELTRESLRIPNVERTNWYDPDPLIKSGSANYYDYQGSGYTRGHLAPAGDMAFSKEAMTESFFMSNMAPQPRAFNNGIWKELEELTRDWAWSNNRLFVVSGPVLNDLRAKRIGKNRVAVPKQFFKVLLDIDEPESKAIAFIVPNEKSVDPVMNYAVTIDEVEELTGLDFFHELLSDSKEEKLESTIQTDKWPVSEKRFRLRVEKWNKER